MTAPATHSPAIFTQQLRKEYGKRAVVQGLDLEVGQGEVFGFLGPNGAGKSTTVKMLLGLVRPTSGRVEVLGGSPADPRVRARLGFLPEQFRFQTWMTAQEFLHFHGELAGLKAAELRARVPQVLERVGLGGRAAESLGGYSKGMLQRCGLAGALLAHPKLVFLDEPTSALDPIGRVEVRDIILSLREEGVAVFLNSHLLSEVEQVCDHLAFVKAGRVLRAGRVGELLGGQLEASLEVDVVTPALLLALQAYTPRQTTARTLSLHLDTQEQLPQVARAVLDAGGNLYALTPHRRELEDLFLELIGPSPETQPSNGPSNGKEARA